MILIHFNEEVFHIFKNINLYNIALINYIDTVNILMQMRKNLFKTWYACKILGICAILKALFLKERSLLQSFFPYDFLKS